MKLSVIIPAFNAAKYIQKCISSVREYEDIENALEIIIVDDGSKDNTLSICQEIANEDNRICVIHQENTGLVGARKKGLENASGEYVTYIDADDYVANTWIENFFSIIQQYHPDMIACGYQEVNIDEDGVVIGSKEIQNCFSEGLYRDDEMNFIKEKAMYANEKNTYTGLIYSACTKAFKKSLLIKSLHQIPNTISIGEDTALTMIALSVCSSIYISKEYGYYYIQRHNSMIHAYNPKEIVQLDNIIELLLTKAFLTEEYISYYILSRLLSFIFKAYYDNRNINIETNEIKRLVRKYPRIRDIALKCKPNSLAMKYRILYHIVKCELYYLIGIYAKSHLT